MQKKTDGPDAIPRIPKQPIHGVLLLDKPVGMSSNDALQKAKRLFRAYKAGHTGTLDPLATGLLPLCFGAATKFSQASLDADKSYRATLQLGVTTTSGDAEGEMVERRPVTVGLERWPMIHSKFLGQISQLPPMYSALKYQGKALYSYARAGVEVPRKERSVVIHQLNLMSATEDTWVIDVSCSKGTYIRTLAQDIGEALGCGAHLKSLRRLSCGHLKVEQAQTLNTLAALTETDRKALLHPPDYLLAEWPLWRLDSPDAARFSSGLKRRVDAPDAPHLRVFGPEGNHFLGSAHISAFELIPDRLLSPLEIQETCLSAPSSFVVDRSS